MDDKAIVEIEWTESLTVQKLLKDYSSLRIGVCHQISFPNVYLVFVPNP